jgi:hypothetical protein
MAAVSGIGFGIFFLASLAIGIRLVVLHRRTGRSPELMIGIGILGIGPAGMALTLMAAAVQRLQPDLSVWLAAFGSLAIAAGSVSAAIFNWRVFRPDSIAARRAVFGLALGYGIGFGLELGTSGFRNPLAPGPSQTTTAFLCTATLIWGSLESLLYWDVMKRRERLGLADPLVTNRFLLWGLGIGSAGVGALVSALFQLLSGMSFSELPALMLSNSMFGLASAVLMWMAFLPPAFWVRRFAARDGAN